MLCCSMKRNLLLLLILFSACKVKAQIFNKLDSMVFDEQSKTNVKLLASDSLCSTFFITIPIGVNMHYNVFHSENVVVTEGTGIMKLGNKEFVIKKGDLIVIPKGTKHSVINTGTNPIKVISVQSPYFDGKDRVWVD